MVSAADLSYCVDTADSNFLDGNIICTLTWISNVKPLIFKHIFQIYQPLKPDYTMLTQEDRKYIAKLIMILIISCLIIIPSSMALVATVVSSLCE